MLRKDSLRRSSVDIGVSGYILGQKCRVRNTKQIQFGRLHITQFRCLGQLQAPLRFKRGVAAIMYD
jgi:hypothetical protein